MAVNRYVPARPRTRTKSPIGRKHPIAAVLAHFHEAWLARHAARRAYRELTALDPRLLRDVGLEPADILRLDQSDTGWRETTIPPHCLPGLAKLAHHLEG